MKNSRGWTAPGTHTVGFHDDTVSRENTGSPIKLIASFPCYRSYTLGYFSREMSTYLHTKARAEINTATLLVTASQWALPGVLQLLVAPSTCLVEFYPAVERTVLHPGQRGQMARKLC
jgi:hypothetical protein